MLEALGPATETWNRSLGELRVLNGSRIHIDGADDGALRIQGKNLRGAWCDEVGLWRRWRRAWEESIAFAVRLDPGKIVATGTPKGGRGIVKLLTDDPDVPVSVLRTIDNKPNLSAAMVEILFGRYEGTRLGRQELEGQILDEVEGALWSWQMIDSYRAEKAPDLSRLVVAVDPATSTGPDADETGVIVAGVSAEEEGYVLADRSLSASPHGWATAAVKAYREFGADRIVAERNQGGEMVLSTLRTVDPNVPVSLVWASRGKQTRAEPVAALYEQGRVHHVGSHPELESQLTGWTVDDKDSPDRLDALVWALTDLMLERQALSPSVPSQPRPGITSDLNDMTW